MALSALGFKRRTYDEILTDKIAKAKELFGEDIETSELTPLGKFLRINAYDQSLTEEEAEAIYYSIFPNSAVGVSLDRLCVFAGISRNPATSARYKVTVTGTAGEVVPNGFLVGTESEINFYNIADAKISNSGTVDIIVECVQTGEIGNVLPSEITQIVNPMAVVESVIGKSVVVVGEEAESDYELRKRFNEAKEGLGSCNEIAIKSALMRIPTVTSAGVIVNDTDSTDSGGRPARSFECYVTGGTGYHQQIAEAIFDKKPIGIKTYGEISQDIVDSGGHTHTIKFSHTTDVIVCAKIHIITDSSYGEDSDHEIFRALANYINNVGVGNPVIRTSLYGLIHSVTGVQDVTELQLRGGTMSDWGTDNITVNEYENCVFDSLYIKENKQGNYGVISRD